MFAMDGDAIGNVGKYHSEGVKRCELIEICLEKCVNMVVHLGLTLSHGDGGISYTLAKGRGGAKLN